MTRLTTELDAIDRALINALHRHPRASMVELARSAEVARGTAYSRIQRLERTGVITGYGPDIDPASAGFGVTAFCTLEIAQGSHAETIAALATIAEITEIHTITGVGDLLCRVVSRSNDHLHEILLQITSVPHVMRSQTQLALHTSHRRSLADLLT